MMIATATVKTKKGFYQDINVKGATVKDLFNKILLALDKAPDEIDGEKLVDWVGIDINIDR